MLAASNAHPVADHGRRRNFSTTVAQSIGAMIAPAFVLALAGVYWATHESDAVSVERQARSARLAMEASVDELALQQEAVAVWHESTWELVSKSPDMGWIHNNVGSWLNRIFGHDEAYALDGLRRPIYAAIGGRQVLPEA